MDIRSQIWFCLVPGFMAENGEDSLKREPVEGEYDTFLREVARARASNMERALADFLEPGDTLLSGRFAIQSKLGRGGMGAVYKALDKERDSTVALKILSRTEPSGIYRLKNEFRSLADVVHPNLVALHELFSDQGLWFFTMDLVAGRDFLTWVRPPESGLDQARLRNSLRQLAEAIDAIHCAGKLHRDLKPSNVLVTPQGRVVLLDFGLASDRQQGGVGQTVHDDSISGTPGYMAPEQSAAKPALAASDFYALGVMLFEALTGRPPFEGPVNEVLLRKQHEDAPVPSSLCEGIAQDLEQLCVQLLQRDPEARPAAAEIMQILGAATDRPEWLAAPEEAPFVGRVQELATLQKAFEATDRGLPVVAFVRGVSGVGKSRLVEQFLRQLRQQCRAVVLTGRCYERESVPYKACDSLIDALSRYLRQLPAEQASNLLPRQVHALARIFPALQRLDAVHKIKQRHPLPPDPNELRRAASLAFKELLSRISDQEPLVVYIDDLQWSDVDGARLLSTLLSPPDAPSLLLIGAYRSEEADTSAGLTVLRERASDLDEVDVLDIELGALDEHESRTLATQLLPDELQAGADRIAQESQGSPFFITELARYIALGGRPEAEQPELQNAIRARAATLPEAERQVLQAICVSARPVEQRLIQSATRTDDIASSLRKLQAQSLVRHTSGPLGKVTSYHDRIREAVVAGLASSELEQWHGRLAKAIETSPEPDLVALTHHRLGAGDFASAGASAVKAAEQANDNLAFDQAAAMYRVALQHAGLGERQNHALRVSLAEALVNGNRSAEGGRTYVRAAKDLTDPAERALLRQKAAEQLLLSGNLDEGLVILKEALADHGMDYDEITEQNPIELIVRLDQRGYEFEPRSESEIEPAQLRRLDMLWAAAKGLANLLPKEWMAFQTMCAHESLDIGEPLRAARALAALSIVRSAIAAETDHALVRLRRFAEDNEDPYITESLARAEGARQFHAMKPRGSLRFMERAETILVQKCTGVSRELSLTRWYILCVLYFLGEIDLLEHKGWKWLEDAREREDLQLITWINVLMFSYWLAQDRPEQARQSLEQGLAAWSENETSLPALAGGMFGALSEAYEGNPEGWRKADQITERFLASQNSFILAMQCLLRHARCITALALASRHPDREELLGRAQEEIEAMENPRALDGRIVAFQYFQALTPLMRAGLAAARGDRDAALGFLDRSLQMMAESEDTNRMYEACARRRKGQLIGRDEGASLIAQAESDLSNLGVTNIPRYCALFAPGFE